MQYIQNILRKVKKKFLTFPEKFSERSDFLRETTKFLSSGSKKSELFAVFLQRQRAVSVV